MNQDNLTNMQKEMSAFFYAFQKECSGLAKKVDSSLQQSLQMQRKELADIAAGSVEKGLEKAISRYNQTLYESNKSLGFKIQQLENSLEAVNRKHKQLVFKYWLGAVICLATIVISASYLLYHYKSAIDQNKLTAELTQKVNEADLRICGENLCAAVSSQKYGKYYLVKKRSAE
ncbi:hypothetical protein BWD09_01395 [Neisseria dentiae]|uniref:MobB n=1 Tax=Neisseria dentiae TaxID=194197 RepID=A0A1X3DFG4_9NEIS|nr:hypothetical protein [Neisseria dentiae]OSI18461.1 hypothetical protein BWD09_01395 [Neisseria dentiae]QMT45653.1 hypothetical protein H3L92_02200 [Neisseria dentiae]